MPDIPESIKDCIFETDEDYWKWTAAVLKWLRAEAREIEEVRVVHERRLKDMVLEFKGAKALIQSRLTNSKTYGNGDGTAQLGASLMASRTVAGKIAHAATLLMNTVKQLNRGLDSVIEAGGDVRAAYTLFDRYYHGVGMSGSGKPRGGRRGMDMVKPGSTSSKAA